MKMNYRPNRRFLQFGSKPVMYTPDSGLEHGHRDLKMRPISAVVP